MANSELGLGKTPLLDYFPSSTEPKTNKAI